MIFLVLLPLPALLTSAAGPERAALALGCLGDAGCAERLLGAVHETADNSSTPSADESECMDDDRRFSEAMIYAVPAFEPFKAFLTCERGASLATQDIPLLTQILGEGNTLTCDGVLGDLCTADAAATCREDLAVRADELCCHSCGRYGGPAQNASNASAQDGAGDGFVFADKAFSGEGKDLASVLTTLGFPVGDFSHQRDLCTWRPWIVCSTSGYSVTLQNEPLGGEMDPAIGALKHAVKLDLSNTSLRGVIPSELGGLASLITLALDRNSLHGTLPESLTKLVNLVTFRVDHNNLTGALQPSFFEGWAEVAIIALSRNSFHGRVPNLDFNVSRHLVTFDAASNAFSAMGAVNWSEYAESISIDLSKNSFRRFPDQLRRAPRLSRLSMRGNAISELPRWGHFEGDTFMEDLLKVFPELENGLELGSPLQCYWTFPGQPPDLEPIFWPFVQSVDLSDNPLNATVNHFLSVFANAPSLSTLHCRNCSLHGRFVASDGIKFRFAMRAGHETDPRNCALHTAYLSLEKLDISFNDDIIGCDVIHADDPHDTSRTRISCSPCPERTQVPNSAATPLSSVVGCACFEGMKEEFDQNLQKECVCFPGYYLHPDGKSCTKCHSLLDCAWGKDPLRSLRPPSIRPRAWVRCLGPGQRFEDSKVLTCYSDSACVGGDASAPECSATSLCTSGRTGRACGECEPERFGGPEGECDPCAASPAETRRFLCIAGVLLVPVLALGVLFLGGKQGQKLSTWKSLKTLKGMSRQMCKHVQLLAVVANIGVSWPAGVRQVFRELSRFTTDVEVLFQASCMTAQNSPQFGAIAKWVPPLVIVLLTFLACACIDLCSRLLRVLPCARLRHLAPAAQQSNLDNLVTFIYLLWCIFFAGLTRNSLMIFECTPQLGGGYTVKYFPRIDCYSDEWWPLAAGGFVACLVYICCYFAMSIWAVRHVTLRLKEGLLDRGPYGFVADGLRDSHVYFNVYAALKDVLLNIIIITCVKQPTTQLLLSAMLVAVYTCIVMWYKPYDTWSSNTLDIWVSSGLALLLILTAGLGFAEDGGSSLENIISTEHAERAAWLLGILLLSLAGPVLLIIYELGLQIPCVVRCLPQWALPASAAGLLHDIALIKEDLSTEALHACLDVMDQEELNVFARLLYGGRNQMKRWVKMKSDVARSQSSSAGRENSNMVGSLSSLSNSVKSLRMQDSEFAVVRSRVSLRRRETHSTIGTENQDTLAADLAQGLRSAQRRASEVVGRISVLGHSDAGVSEPIVDQGTAASAEEGTAATAEHEHGLFTSDSREVEV